MPVVQQNCFILLFCAEFSYVGYCLYLVLKKKDKKYKKMTGRITRNKTKVATVRNGKITRTKSIGTRRTRTRTKRYGSRESDVNGDEFFENLVATETSTSTSEENIQQLSTEISAIHSMSPEVIITDPKSPARPFSRLSVISSEISSFLEQQPETNSSVSDGSSQRLPFEEIVLRKLDEILIRVTQLEKNGAKLQAQLNVLTSEIGHNSEDRTNVVNELGTADVVILSEMGLPVKSAVALQRLEDNLSDAEYVKSVVSMP